MLKQQTKKNNRQNKNGTLKANNIGIRPGQTTYIGQVSGRIEKHKPRQEVEIPILNVETPYKYYNVNWDLQNTLARHDIRSELLPGDDMNDIIYEAHNSGVDAILMEFKYDLYNNFKRIREIATALLDYIITNEYKQVIITMPHYCIMSIDTDPICDLYVEQFSESIVTYLRKYSNTNNHKLTIKYLGKKYNNKHIPRQPRVVYDMNRHMGKDQPMRVMLRKILTSKAIRRNKAILIDIHSFPKNSYGERQDTEIVLLQRIIKQGEIPLFSSPSHKPV